MSRATRFLARHFGLCVAAAVCVAGVVLFKLDLKTTAIVVVSIGALWIGDAWDEDTSGDAANRLKGAA